jgi:hypothetical protein
MAMIEFKPRYFVPPAVALTVLALLHAPADGGRSARSDCGPAWHVADPGIRASFAAFQRRQSAAAVKVCALANNNAR